MCELVLEREGMCYSFEGRVLVYEFRYHISGASDVSWQSRNICICLHSASPVAFCKVPA